MMAPVSDDNSPGMSEADSLAEAIASPGGATLRELAAHLVLLRRAPDYSDATPAEIESALPAINAWLASPSQT
jgi:hypothetical protein